MGHTNSAPPADALTIDELAERIGMTVRNLREWRTLGLLPRAEMYGRVGYYSPAVVDRVLRIKDLHAEGFTLELISRMLEAGGDAGDEVMRLAALLHAPVEVDENAGDDPHGRLERIDASLKRLGLDDDLLTGTLTLIRGHAEAIAAHFEQVWMREVWEPFVAAGMPEPELPRIQATAAQMKSLSVETVAAVFAAAMDAQIERGIARELDRVRRS